jgi:hypothetical protein
VRRAGGEAAQQFPRVRSVRRQPDHRTAAHHAMRPHGVLRLLPQVLHDARRALRYIRRLSGAPDSDAKVANRTIRRAITRERSAQMY